MPLGPPLLKRGRQRRIPVIGRGSQLGKFSAMRGCGIRQERLEAGTCPGGDILRAVREASPRAAARPACGAPALGGDGAGGRGDRVHRARLRHRRRDPPSELTVHPVDLQIHGGRLADRPARAAVLPSAPRGAAVRLDRPRARPQFSPTRCSRRCGSSPRCRSSRCGSAAHPAGSAAGPRWRRTSRCSWRLCGSPSAGSAAVSRGRGPGGAARPGRCVLVDRAVPRTVYLGQVKRRR